MAVLMNKLFAIMALLAFPSKVFPQDTNTPAQCNAVAITVRLQTDQDLQRRINDLTFKMRRITSTGWVFSLEDAKGRDYIYPVNPSLRLNGSQTLGAGYGDTAKQSLSHGRELHFLLSETDYDAFVPYLTNALWPYNAPDPEHAIFQYGDALDKLRTGLLRLSVIRSDISEDDRVQSAEFGLDFIAPVGFRFDASLVPRALSCPPSLLPIRSRLPARIPPADRSKFSNIHAAADWKNPYLMITYDGFDLRFQGGHLMGPLSILAQTVVGLPDSMWPYGRVVAASISGVRRTGENAAYEVNKAEADRILKELGLQIDWWPSA
jgi:hypothetical protein